MKRQDWVPAPHLTGASEKFEYTLEAHSPQRSKSIPFALVCKHCGLIYLKNDFTRWAIRMGCNNRYHPDLKTVRNRMGARL